ncbi:MAG: hypothetical protein K2Y39_24000 [Candidatus Obscuribacterales bacterium]|nr:hypothetical protein [Candidatus Obscuribacterales bacterium]
MKSRHWNLGTLFITCILVASCTADAPLINKANGSAYCSIPTRWSTVEKSYPPEVRLKEKTIEHIEQFWSDFKKDQTTLNLALENLHGESGKANADILVGWMKEHLDSIDPVIEYEFGPARGKEGKKLDFSACGHDEVIQICKLLVAKAPKLPNWQFSSYRQPLPAGEIVGGFKGRAGREPIQFETSVSVSPQNKLDVIFTSPEFQSDEADNVQACLILSDLSVGEENDDIWLGVITPKKGSLMGQFNCANNAQQYAKAFDEKKKELLASLPGTPYFKQDLSKTEEVHFSGKRRLSMKTALKKLAETLGAGGRFHDVQFSKNGEKFAYLKIPKAKDLQSFEKVEALAKELDAELRKAQAGCVFGVGIESPDIVYLDIVLADLAKATPLLKSFSESHKLAHDSALRFYDCVWRNEWVGMFDDTKKPQDLKSPWYLVQEN